MNWAQLLNLTIRYWFTVYVHHIPTQKGNLISKMEQSTCTCLFEPEMHLIKTIKP